MSKRDLVRGHPTHQNFGLPSKTKQEFKDDTNIRVIVAKYGQRGLWDHVQPQRGTFGDFTKATDLAEALLLVQDAKRSFESLPPGVRRACGQSPVELLQKLATREGAQELADAGLEILVPEGEPPVTPTPSAVAAAPEAAPVGTAPEEG